MEICALDEAAQELVRKVNSFSASVARNFIAKLGSGCFWFELRLFDVWMVSTSFKREEGAT
jgi:hypothetical protein